MGNAMQCLASSAACALVPAAHTRFVAVEQQPAQLAVFRAAAVHGAIAGQLESAAVVERDHWRAVLTLALNYGWHKATHQLQDRVHNCCVRVSQWCFVHLSVRY